MKDNSAQQKRIAEMKFASVYPLYLAKIEKKGRTKDELDQVIEWLTGFNSTQILNHINQKSSFELFFEEANLHPNAVFIQGLICGYRVEEIDHLLTRKVRYLDKLVDELAKGRAMEKILRTGL